MPVGPDGLDLSPDTQNRQDAFRVIGEHMQTHLCVDAIQGPKMGRNHPCLERSNRVFDGLSADAPLFAGGLCFIDAQV